MLLLLPASSPAYSQGLSVSLLIHLNDLLLHRLFLLFSRELESGGDKQMVNNEKAKDTSNPRTLK